MKKKSTLYERLHEKCEKEFPEVLKSFPIAEQIDRIYDLPRYAHYHFLSDEIKLIHQQIEDRYSSAALQLYLKLLLLKAMDRISSERPTLVFPDALKKLQKDELIRIQNDMSHNPLEFYRPTSDLFLKDLSLVTGRMLYLGGWMIEVSSKIPKKIALRGGLRQFFNYCSLVFLRSKSLGPYFQIHASDRHLDHFNEPTRHKMYLQIAELLHLNPEIKGVFGASWYYDPVIPSISPRLGYLQDTPVQNGAKLFFESTDENSKKLSTLKSKTRENLVEKGQYVPKKFLLLWLRDDIIRWHQNEARKTE